MTSLYEQFFMTSAGRLCILDQNGYILAVNTAFCHFLSYSTTELVNQQFQEFVHPQHLHYFLAHLNDNQCENLLLLVRKKDGGYQNIYWHHHIIDGCLQAKLSNDFRFAPYQTDHTNSLTTFDTILNRKVLDDGVWDWNLEKDTIYYSPRWKEIIGYTDDELYNDVTTWQNHIHQEDLQTTLSLIEDYNSGKVPVFELVQRYYHKNNTTVFVHCRATHFKNANGDVVRMVGIVNDITKIKLAEERQRKSERILSKAQEIVKMGSWEWDTIENKITWSEQLYKLLGFEVDEFMPEPESFLKYLYPEDKSRVMTMMWSCIRNQKAETIECRAIRKDKQVILVRCEGYIEYDSFNTLVRVIGVIWDITEQKKSELELIKAKELAEASVKAKEQFISTMSHEIRTPMNAVIGMTNLLLQEKPQVHQVEYLQVLQSAAKNLLLLINDILDFSKIEAGKIIFENIDFNLKDTLNNIVNIYIYSAKEKGLELELDYDAEIYPLLIGDTTKLTQILTNFISNAIKFTNKGGVKIAATFDKEFDNQVFVRFSVKDSGIGIPPEKIESIFDSFTQASIDTTRKFGGTGLGLTIARNLVELQGGKITLVSKLGEGSEFSFVLSFPKSKMDFIPLNSQENTLLMSESLAGIHVLVAEDNEANRFVVSRFLMNWKVAYEFAVNGHEVIAKIQERRYDMIFMDLHMPELDGYEATKAIRNLSDNYYQEVPIIALTASVLSSIVGKLTDLGINDFLMKPFEPKDLHQLILKYGKKTSVNIVNTDKIFSNYNESIVETHIQYINIDSINFSQFEAITMGDKGFGNELLQLYVKQFDEYLIDLEVLVRNKQGDGIKTLNHKIKSTITILQLTNSLYKEQHLLENIVINKEIDKIVMQFEKVKELCNKTKDLIKLRLVNEVLVK